MNLDFNIPEQEQHELDLLAAELRDAMPVSELSSDFQQRLEARMRSSWTLRGAFERNGLIRAAAAMLMVTLAAAPVAAWVGLWPQQKKNPPAIAFDLPEMIDVDESLDAHGDLSEMKVIGPVDEFDLLGLSEDSRLALQQNNYRARLELAKASLLAASEASVAQGAGPLAFVTRSQASQPAAQSDSWIGLWQEFGRLCLAEPMDDLSAALLARCHALLSTELSANAPAEEIAARAAWGWVLYGKVAAAGSVELAWDHTPFVATR
jgi:hypothetical protein